MTRPYALLGMLVVVLALAPSCELAAGQLLAQFQFEIVPEAIEIEAGSSGSVKVVIKPLTGVTLTTVTVRLINAPGGVTGEPSTLTVFTESPWTIAVAANVPPGRYEQVEVEAASQGINLLPVTRRRSFTLVVPDQQ